MIRKACPCRDVIIINYREKVMSNSKPLFLFSNDMRRSAGTVNGLLNIIIQWFY